MGKDPAVQGQYQRALAGVASVLGSTAAPPIVAGGVHAGAVQCTTCGLYLPRSATHADVLSHPCYRGFTVSISAAGQLSLA